MWKFCHFCLSLAIQVEQTTYAQATLGRKCKILKITSNFAESTILGRWIQFWYRCLKVCHQVSLNGTKSGTNCRFAFLKYSLSTSTNEWHTAQENYEAKHKNLPYRLELVTSAFLTHSIWNFSCRLIFGRFLSWSNRNFAKFVTALSMSIHPCDRSSTKGNHLEIIHFSSKI